MLPVMSTNSWFPTMFDEFFNNDWMPKMKATAPAINVKENGSGDQQRPDESEIDAHRTLSLAWPRSAGA